MIFFFHKGTCNAPTHAGSDVFSTHAARVPSICCSRNPTQVPLQMWVASDSASRFRLSSGWVHGRCLVLRALLCFREKQTHAEFCAPARNFRLNMPFSSLRFDPSGELVVNHSDQRRASACSPDSATLSKKENLVSSGKLLCQRMLWTMFNKRSCPFPLGA